jgi:hypothetical protein
MAFVFSFHLLSDTVRHRIWSINGWNAELLVQNARNSE